jgi:murein L,D-transpeptidase YafK
MCSERTDAAAPAGQAAGAARRRWRLPALAAALLMVAAILSYRFWPEPPPLPASARADLVVVDKAERRLALMRDGEVLKSYRVALGGDPRGHKQREGDGRTPEGRYAIDGRNPASSFHRALHVSYPDGQDRARAAASGDRPGGDIMIHGIRNGLGWLGPLHRLVDWTDGCIAVTDAEIREIWRAVPTGTPVEIRP